MPRNELANRKFQPDLFHHGFFVCVGYLAKTTEMTQWFKIDDPGNPPPKDGKLILLAYPPDDDESDWWYQSDRWVDWPREINADSWTVGGRDPSHWMPLPEPPE